MDLSASIDDFTVDGGNWRYAISRMSMSIWPSRISTQDRHRRNARRSLKMKTKPITGRIERPPQKTRVSGYRHDEAFTAIVAAAMLACVPLRPPLALMDARFAKYVLVPARRSEMDDKVVQMGSRPLFPVESRLPSDREDPCSFRTRLIDPMADSEADMAFGSTDMLNCDDLAFDDVQCISVGRSTRKFKAVSGTATPQRDYHAQANEDHDDKNNTNSDMETMNMPFWNLPRRQKQHIFRGGDTIPDDMSIISDASLIPTYYPSDIMKQQQQQPQRSPHRTLIKQLFRAKARAAKQTVRQLKRSCRDAVGHVFVDPASHRGPKCVAVGSVY
ncbi:uncharacterized protein B0H64DRAFT_90909 [Chaetomium fimeti]|uniref:Uncharacterized protein n=1 Tax=Chaetomium fimeti TaxID=1854472 RepID=A0AAE0HM65_9PEZI|nr:hypothetical protein B0H64DRAFT_90909 [Chaetomium fimeti]